MPVLGHAIPHTFCLAPHKSRCAELPGALLNKIAEAESFIVRPQALLFQSRGVPNFVESEVPDAHPASSQCVQGGAQSISDQHARKEQGRSLFAGIGQPSWEEKSSAIAHRYLGLSHRKKRS